MDIKEEFLESNNKNDEILDVPDFVELKYLEEIKNESIEIKTEPIELKCGDCNEKFTNKISLKIHEMFHSKTNYCFVCKRTMILNFHEHIRKRHLNHICEICSKVFTLKKSLDTHIRSHTKERKFKCGQCDKSFMQRGTLTSHFRTTHIGIKPFVCKICEGTFTTSSSLRKHHRKLHSGNETHECRICSKKFFDKKKYRDHERSHTISNECEICGKLFKKSDSKSKHLVTQHFKTVECIYCKKMFHKSLIDAHIVELHPPRMCDVCNMTFYNARLFNFHKLSHAKRITCRLCGKNYNETHMEKHLQLHREGKIKKCNICNCVYLDIEKHNLRVHKNTKYIFCYVCMKRFTTRISKSKHVFRVHLRKLAKHTCNFCGKRFKASSKLREHLNLHYRLRPYKCLMCKKGFKYLHRLENHKKRHELRLAPTDYKFSCTACGRKFKIEISLKQHKCMAGKFECGICGLKYKQKHYLKNHLITYHSPTISPEENNCDPIKSLQRKKCLFQGSTGRYQCKKCKMVFTHWNLFRTHFCKAHRARGYTYSVYRKRCKTKGDAVQHIKEKLPKKKLKCGKCEYMCINKPNMSRHYARMHQFKGSEGVNRPLMDRCISENEEKYIIENMKIKIEESKICKMEHF